jgi:hypothetical protein
LVLLDLVDPDSHSIVGKLLVEGKGIGLVDVFAGRRLEQNSGVLPAAGERLEGSGEFGRF